MSATLSIIIATYNAERTLHNALESVVNQLFPDWECIVVDGSSCDDTIEIVKRFVEKDHRFKYLSEPDNGIYDAYNKGWKLAQGKWIYYMGADDVLLRDAFTFLQSSDYTAYDIIYGSVVFKKGSRLLYKESIQNLDSLRRRMICSHQAVIMKRDVIVSMNGFSIKYKISADYDLLLRCYLAKKSFIYINQYIAIFSCGGISSNNAFGTDAYLIRNDNKSVSKMMNYLLYFRRVCKSIVRKLYYWFRNSIRPE